MLSISQLQATEIGTRRTTACHFDAVKAGRTACIKASKLRTDTITVRMSQASTENKQYQNKTNPYRSPNLKCARAYALRFFNTKPSQPVRPTCDRLPDFQAPVMWYWTGYNSLQPVSPMMQRADTACVQKFV